MKRIASLFAVLCLLATSVAAQTMESMAVVVEPLQIKIGAETFHRSLTAPSVLIVPAGQTVIMPDNRTYDYVEVAGTLMFSRIRNTNSVVKDFVNLPGGVLDVGTVENPIPCNIHVEVVFKNTPIDSLNDPFQWGNGLLNFGTQTRVGCAKTPYLDSIASLSKGATTIVLEKAPDGWRVGDELFLPDLAQPVLSSDGVNMSAAPGRVEGKVTIASLNGAVLTLSKPLDYEHDSIIDTKGVVVVRPIVANLTRNIVFRSENSANPTVGTRGHTANLGKDARSDVRYNKFDQLGRTSNHPLDDTNLVTGHFGLNQRGKYADHDHHIDSCPSCVTYGNVYLGNALTTKWGKVCHDCSDTWVEQNIVIGFPGGGIVTEDGPEVRNHFGYNLVANINGNPGDALGFNDDVGIATNSPGSSGACYWMHSAMNYFYGNKAIGCFRGIDLFNQQYRTGAMYPSVPLGMPDTIANNHLMVPLLFKGNVAAANVNAGFEFWAVNAFNNIDLISANNANAQVFGVLSDQIEHFMTNPTLICSIGSNAVAIHASQAYTKNFIVNNGKIVGCAIGVSGGGGSAGLTMRNVYMENQIDIDSLPHVALFDNVLFAPLANYPKQYITLGGVGRFTGPIWNPIDALPDIGDSPWRNQQGSKWQFINFQGTGKDYLLLPSQSLEDNIAWYSSNDVHGWNPPIKGLTMKQAWDQLGMGYAGDMLLNVDAVSLEGIVNGMGRETLNVKFPQPRAIVTSPTLRDPAIGFGNIGNFLLTIRAEVTGFLTGVADAFMYQVDNGQVFNLRDQGPLDVSSDRSFNLQLATLGTHTLKVWLTQAGGLTPIPGSVFTSQFCVGGTKAAPWSTTEFDATSGCTTNVPVLRGLTQAYAGNWVSSSLLKVGTNPTRQSSTFPVGTVLGSTPSSDTALPPGSTIELILSSGGGVGTPTDVVVPNVVGQQQSVASATLTATQLTLGSVSTSQVFGTAVGTVVSTAPAAGASVPIGTAVNLVVATTIIPPPCTFTVSAVVMPVPFTGTIGIANVTTQPTDCTWSASNDSPWLTIDNGVHTGTGAINYTVAPNTGAERSATLTVAGKSFVVIQQAVPIVVVEPPYPIAFCLKWSDGTFSGCVNIQ